MIFEIENKSNVKWENLSYELVSIQDDTMLEVKTGHIYNWIVQPNSSSYYLSVDSDRVGATEGITWELKIKNLKVPLF
ncbi:MAG: hypothetical protein BM565_12945 [Gammaproteobacteria bacterium MedPE]|nr:MAG: hypothetical protein BM565_12945 [Gammaproteobacteria bacterium MedPE]